MARGEVPVRLTVRERILIHLAERVASEAEYHVPEDVTQSGLAAAVGIAQKHVPQYVRPLMDDRLVEERSAHVAGGRQRRKAYALTDAGRREAVRLREELLIRDVSIELDSGPRTMALREAMRGPLRGSRLLDILDRLDAGGVLTPMGAVDRRRIAGSATAQFLLEEADALEARDEWTEAAERLRRVLPQVTGTFATGVLEERLAYATFRSAMQADTTETFIERVEAVLAGFRRAKASYEGSEEPTASARSARCAAWIAYASFWQSTDPQQKKELVEETWRLTKNALDAFQTAGAVREFGLTYLQLSLAAFIVVHHGWDAQARAAVLREGHAYGEMAIDLLETVQEPETLGAVCVRAVGFSQALAIDYVSAPEEREARTLRDLDAWKRAVGLSEPAALRELALASLGGAYVLWGPGTEDSLTIFRRALEEVDKTKDRLLAGCANDAVAFHTEWRAATFDDPKEAVAVLGEALTHARAAGERFAPIAFVGPTNGTLWCLDPDPDYRVLLGEQEPDVGRKRELLRTALDAIPELASRIERSGYPYLMSYGHRIASAALEGLAKIEVRSEEKSRLLEEAMAHREQQLGVERRILLPGSWDVALTEASLADLQSEVALISQDPATKRALLDAAIALQEKAIRSLQLAVSSVPSMEPFTIGRTQFDWGDLLLRLHAWEADPSTLVRAEEAFLGAAESFARADFPNRVAESQWKAAKVLDLRFEYSKAADHFEAATASYESAARRFPGLEALYKDHARYMRAWSDIEKARHHHARQEYGRSREFYERAAALSMLTTRWRAFAPDYHAWAKLEDAEDLSRRERSTEAIAAYGEAIQFFEQTQESLERERAALGDPEQRDLVEELIGASPRRRDYCRARILLEEAKLLEKEGSYASAAEKHGLAAAALAKLADASDREEGRRELRLIEKLARAWQQMAAAEAEASSDRFVEAARLFAEARDLAASESSRTMASGHSRLCSALAAGVRFADTRDVRFHGEAARQLESAAMHYEKAGFPTAAEAAKGSKLLFDAYIYLDQANEATDPGTRAKLYTAVETILEACAEAFQRAILPAKEKQVERLRGRVREQRALAISLSELLRAPSLASTATGFESPTATYEAAVGLDRFRHADIHGNVAVDRRSILVEDTLPLELDLVNAGRAPAQLLKVENLNPEGFDLVGVEGHCSAEETFLDMKGRRLEPLKREGVKIVLRPKAPGVFTFRPRILYMDENGESKVHELSPVEVTVRG